MESSAPRYTKELKHVSCLGGGGRNVTFRFPEPCPIESFVVSSMKWVFYDGKVRGNIWHPVFRRNKEELSAQIECTDSGGVRRDKELIELILKYLEGPEVEKFLQDMNYGLGIEIPKDYAREIKDETKPVWSFQEAKYVFL